MSRLPVPGSDNGTWGNVLNDYLLQAHKADGTLKDNSVTANNLAPSSVTNAAIASDAVNTNSIADGAITEPLLASAVQTKLNATGDWNTLSNKPAVIAAGADQAAARAAIGTDERYIIGSVYATIANLRSATTSTSGFIRVMGYYAAGDGGGGIFRWDSTDTTSTDNGGTIITPSGALSSSGRWKRVYEGEVNARWFGAHPGQSATVNTAAFQAGIDWIQTDQTRNPSGGYGSGTLFIPMGYYRVNGSITVSQNYVLIRGEGPSTMLTVREHARPSQLDYLFIFSASFKAIGGGIRDLCVAGNSMLKWAIYLNTWHAAAFENILVNDVHSGILDAESTLSPNCGENILVRHCDYNSTSSSPTTGCLTQYGIRFRSTAGASWSDCEIRDCMAVGIWDTGIVLDGVIRFDVRKCDVSMNYSSPNTIDGTTRAGVMHGVRITHTVNGTWSSAAGQHVIDGVYMESHEGSEDVVNYCAVLIESPSGGGQYNRYNRISNINTSWNVGLAPALFRITNAAAVDGTVSYNTFTGNRRPVSDNQIVIGTFVRETFLNLTPNNGSLGTIKVYDLGTRTYINGIRNGAYRNGATWPDNTLRAGEVDVGGIVRDTVTGRTVWQDQFNDPVLIGPRPGLDVVAPFGAQRISALATPAAPRVTPTGSGSTTWTYYVVAIDKDGNKTPPSPVGTTTAGPVSLTSSTFNAVQWFPIEGAVKYDLLRGSTATSIATNLVTTHYNDPGTATSAYTPSAVSPPGDLTVDGTLNAGTLQVAGAPVATTTGVQTLTNKTLTSPALSNPTATGTTSVAQGGVISIYNTVDQTTNYERVRHFWSSNRYFIYSENGGTGTLRPIELRSRGGVILWQTPIAPATGTVQITDSTNSANTAILGVNGTHSATSIGGGPQIALAVWPTINQSSTAAFTALSVNVTETAVGSGAHLLADFQVGGVSRAKIDDTGVISAVASPTAGTVPVRAAVPATATSTGTAGQIAWDATFIYVCTATNTWVRAALSTW
jgi:hypothetical protein